VTSVLGENATGALNALVPVPASGGGRRPCARRLQIRPSLFPYSRVAGTRALIDSLDTLSVFEAVAVDNRTRDWAERRVGSLELCMDNLDMDISWGTVTSQKFTFENHSH